MWIVVDWNKTKLYGPFQDEVAADRWIAEQGIQDYDLNEVSVNKVLSIDNKLEDIVE